MLSAPAAIPATIAAALPPGLAPVDRSGRTRRPTRPARSTVSASRMTGTSPAHDTRFESSNTASTARPACNNRIYEMPSRPGFMELRQLPFFRVRGHLHVRRTGIPQGPSVDPGLVSAALGVAAAAVVAAAPGVWSVDALLAVLSSSDSNPA